MKILDRLKSNEYKKVNVEITNEDTYMYESSITFEGNKIKFEDKTVEKTYIEIEILDQNSIHLTRDGSISMDVIYKSNTKSITTYTENESGLKMELDTICNNVLINENKIIIKYANYNYENDMTNVTLNFTFS